MWQRDDDAEFLPPEVAHGEASGPGADIWALGLCIWQLLEPDLDLTSLRLQPGDIRAAMHKTAAFERWRGWAYVAPDLGSDQGERSEACALTRALGNLNALDAPLAQCLLERMLCAEAEGRSGASQVSAFAASRAAELASDEVLDPCIQAHMALAPLRGAQKALLN